VDGTPPGAARPMRVPAPRKKGKSLSATCGFRARWPDCRRSGRAIGKVDHHPGFSSRPMIGERPCFWAAAALGYTARIFAAKIERGTAGDLDRRARPLSANPRAVPTAEAAAGPALRRGAGNRQQRREGAASALHTAGGASTKYLCMSMRPRRRGLEGTIVSANVADSAAQVKAIAIKKGITLVSMDSPGMLAFKWGSGGCVSDLQAGGLSSPGSTSEPIHRVLGSHRQLPWTPRLSSG